jgi:exopolysaccharide biosynthesis polyprenyl glycosylphosphotransferase
VAVLSKTRHYERLSQVLDNLQGIFAWVLMVHVLILLDKITYNQFYEHIALLVLVAPIQGMAFYIFSTESPLPGAQLAYLAKAVGTVLLGIFAVVFVVKLSFVSRTVVLGYGLMTFVGLLATKLFLYYWYFYGRKERAENYTKVLIIGSGARAIHVANSMRKSGNWGLEIIGFLDPEPGRAGLAIDLDSANRVPNINGGSLEKSLLVAGMSELSGILSRNVVDEVVIATPRKLLDSLEPMVQLCLEEGIRIRLAADVYDTSAVETRVSMFAGLPMLEYSPVSQNADMLIIKRIFDLVATMLALPILIPLFLAIGVAIKLDSRGPVFFIQERVGLGKRRFKMYKFRSMQEGAEKQLSEVEHLNEAAGPIFKIKNDPRLTRVGKFIRKFSLDELPQLFNVLLGDMSLVGPRPMSVRDVELFDRAVQRQRFGVRPGCTCLWQISGRSDLPFEEWLELDLRYIRSWNIGLDLKILLLTIPALVTGAGAH